MSWISTPFLFFLLTSLLLWHNAWSYTVIKKIPKRLIEDFEDKAVGQLPVAFRTFPFQRPMAREVYQVALEGENRYLRAEDSQNLSVQVFREFGWQVKEHPFFSWRWRARLLPAGGNEGDVATNDSACGVYVVFGKYTGTAIKYVWSSTLPAGTVVEKKPGRFYIVSKEMGSQKSWQKVTVNILEDYQKLFHKEPDREPSGFGLLTDGNALKTEAACDYDDFVISRDPS